jgi:hypothetical protein
VIISIFDLKAQYTVPTPDNILELIGVLPIMILKLMQHC